MPGIGSLIREIDIKIVRNLIKANKLLLSKTSSRLLSVKYQKGAGEGVQLFGMHLKHNYGYRRELDAWEKRFKTRSLELKE